MAKTIKRITKSDCASRLVPHRSEELGRDTTTTVINAGYWPFGAINGHKLCMAKAINCAPSTRPLSSGGADRRSDRKASEIFRAICQVAYVNICDLFFRKCSQKFGRSLLERSYL